MTGGRKDGRARLTAPEGETPIIVLVRPQLAENIGTAARAMANGGLFHLRLVAPRDGWPQERAWYASSGADRILEILKSMQRVTGDPRYRPSLWLQRRVQLGMPLTKA